MGSSVRYCNVTITTYSIGGFHGLARMFFMGSHFSSMDEPMNSLVGEKLQAHIEVKRETNRHNGQPHLFTAFSNPGEPPTYPTRMHHILAPGLLSSCLSGILQGCGPEMLVYLKLTSCNALYSAFPLLLFTKKKFLTSKLQNI